MSDKEDPVVERLNMTTLSDHGLCEILQCGAHTFVVVARAKAASKQEAHDGPGGATFVYPESNKVHEEGPIMRQQTLQEFLDVMSKDVKRRYATRRTT